MGWSIVLLLFFSGVLFNFGLTLSVTRGIVYSVLSLSGVAMMVYSQVLLYRHIKERNQNILYGIFITTCIVINLLIGTPLFIFRESLAQFNFIRVISIITSVIWWAMWIVLFVYLYKSRIKTTSDYSYRSPGYSNNYSLSGKTCSACGKQVSLSSAAGQRCPHCGAYWSTERTTYR